MARICLSMCVLVLMIGAVAPLSRAQGQAPLPQGCIHTILWNFPDPVPFGWWIPPQGPVTGQGPYSYYISTYVCDPPGPPPPPKCLRNSTSPACGSPISLSTGNTYIDQQDLKIPGLGGGLSLSRTWNSIWPGSVSTFQNGAFGPNWRSTYEERFVMGLDNFIKYIRSDGTVWSFKGGSGTMGWVVAAPANQPATLNTDTSVNPYYVLTFQNGEQRRFDENTGNLIAIIDRNGNTTTIAYDSSERLSSVTDAASRQLTFTYAGTNNRVTAVTSSVGVSLSYSYDTQGRLAQVTKQDGTTLNFAYNAQSLISSVTDSNGKVLESHTYDSSNRGLTSARAGGIESVTVSYPNP
jgi:YD repeat-containing protein